jgi:hypothetical protein
MRGTTAPELRRRLIRTVLHDFASNRCAGGLQSPQTAASGRAQRRPARRELADAVVQLGVPDRFIGGDLSASSAGRLVFAVRCSPRCGKTITFKAAQAGVGPANRLPSGDQGPGHPGLGFKDKTLGHYEEDHLIPLAVGGSPRSPKNLWPLALQGQAGSAREGQARTVPSRPRLRRHGAASLPRLEGRLQALRPLARCAAFLSAGYSVGDVAGERGDRQTGDWGGQ